MEQKSILELFNLKGKTAIVTGGAMGIGYGIALRLAEAGANVVIADLDEEVGKKNAELLGRYGVKTVFFRTDVSEERDVKELIAKTIKQFGKLDIMVNNAGIFPQKLVLEMDLAFWEKTQAVNLRGTFLCCREAGRSMGESGGGVIINIASIDARHPSMVGLASYDAAKHGVWGFTKNFALEVAKKGIRVNAIAPGGIATEGVRSMVGGDQEKLQQMIKGFKAKVPLGSFGKPDDIATVALFLASEASAYMTGAMVVVDGGVLLT